MASAAALTDLVKHAAAQVGFARVGIASAAALPPAVEALYRDWIASGRDADTAYLQRNVDVRFRPRLLLGEARSVICLAVSYAPAAPWPTERPFVARYARGRDYHKFLKKWCRHLCRRLERAAGPFASRIFVDAGPIAERSLAVAAGLGFIGRNGCLVVPGLGSYVVLCEILTDLPLLSDAPAPGDCGDCHACQTACPTGALDRHGLVDCRLCLSFQTIENRGAIDPALWPAMSDRLFGCDSCQQCCPHNQDLPPGAEGLRGDPDSFPDLAPAAVLGWSEEQWGRATAARALRRAKKDMLVRNAAIVAGNRRDASCRAVLDCLAEMSEDTPVRAAARWAREQLGSGGNAPDGCGVHRETPGTDAPARNRKDRDNMSETTPPTHAMDHEAIEKAVYQMLRAIGEDPDREGLRETPARVARMYAELFGGLHEDPAEHLQVAFTEEYDEMVILRDIPFHSMCEHHLMPFTGRAHVAYLPKGKVIGVSKMARVVESFARRPQVQERLTCQIADLMMEQLDAKGAAVIIEATHTCMTLRGVKKPGSVMVTSAMRGLLKSNMSTRSEAIDLLVHGNGRG